MEKATVPKEEPGPSSGLKLEELGVGTALAAIGGGLGILGFVAFFGAAILWVRMDKLGLPGNDALAVVPKPVLVSTGASFLVPALLIAIAFTLLLYVTDSFGVWLSEFPVRRLQLWVIETDREAEDYRQEARRHAQVADSASARLDRITAAAAPGPEPQLLELESEGELRNICEKARQANAKATSAEKVAVEFKADLELTAAEIKRKTERIRLGILLVVTVGLFVALTWVVIDSFDVQHSGDRWWIIACVAAALVTLCVAVRLRTRSFGWLAVAAFVAVGLMMGTLTYYRTVDDPKIEPAAILRSHGPPLFGFYVTQTSDRVYLATTPRKGLVRLDSVPREEVLELLVGRLERPAAAEARALAFAHRLCLTARQRKITGRVAGKDRGGKIGEEISDGCTNGDLHRLEERQAAGSQAAATSAPAASRRASARSVFSQVKSSSPRPKWP